MTTNTIIGMAAIAALIFKIGFTRAEQVTNINPRHCLLLLFVVCNNTLSIYNISKSPCGK